MSSNFQFRVQKLICSKLHISKKVIHPSCIAHIKVVSVAPQYNQCMWRTRVCRIFHHGFFTTLYGCLHFQPSVTWTYSGNQHCVNSVFGTFFGFYGVPPPISVKFLEYSYPREKKWLHLLLKPKEISRFLQCREIPLYTPIFAFYCISSTNFWKDCNIKVVFCQNLLHLTR